MSQTLLALILAIGLLSSAVSANEPPGEAHGSAAIAVAGSESHPSSDSGGGFVKKLWTQEADTNQPPLQADIYLLVFTIVCFLLFINVMKSFAWQPMIAGLDERDARVVRAEQSAAKVQHEAERLRKVTEARMAEVHTQVKAMLAQARSEAEAQGMEIIARAEAEAQRIKDSALQEIESARQQAVAELDSRIDSQVALATSHLMN